MEIGEFRDQQSHIEMAIYGSLYGSGDQMVETGRFRFSLGKVGGVESGSYLAPWILCFAVRGYCTVRQIYFLKNGFYLNKCFKYTTII